MLLTRAVAVALALIALAIPMSVVQLSVAQQGTDLHDITSLVGDVQRGKVVFRSIGGCVNCHGWPGDGRTGLDMRSPTGANLRESQLDRDSLIEVVACGRPTTQMPYHDRNAYRDTRCYGMVAADFAPDTAPNKGKGLREQDIANVVTFLQEKVIGRGLPTFEECVDTFDNPDASGCKNLK